MKYKYSVFLRRSAEKSLKGIPKQYQKNIYKHLLDLGEDPRGTGSKKLSGVDHGYRRVAWPYRILYTIDDSKRMIDVYLIAHRKEAYR